MDIPDWISAIILGVVEGLTEFLPVSSTGHLMVCEAWLGFQSEVFTIFIQLGALAAVWWLFRHRLAAVLPWTWRQDGPRRRLALNVALGFIPIAVVGLLAHHWIREHLHTPRMIAWATIGGGVAILLIEAFKPRVRVEELDSLPPLLALGVGLGQSLALWPGVSRSGATIMAGLVLGLSRSVATEYTFLLAVPTMTAATGMELWQHRQDLSPHLIGLLLLGFAVAFGVALAVVKWFIRFVQGHTFNAFAWYRIVAGAVLLFLLSRGFFADRILPVQP